MRKFTGQATLNNKKLAVVHAKYSYSALREAYKAAFDKIWLSPSFRKMFSPAEGSKMVFNIELAVECTMNRRAKPRSKAVIKAEHNARAERFKTYLAHQKKLAEEQVEARKATRRQIVNQIEHAFKTGKAGAESAVQYITCTSCQQEADVLYLNQPLPPGATVLDEATIQDARCSQHDYVSKGNKYYATNQGVGQVVKCSRLEFFYDGVRQIALKAGK
jgi:hypothetical protein